MALVTAGSVRVVVLVVELLLQLTLLLGRFPRVLRMFRLLGVLVH
jgi:hypothetical protein